VFNSAAKLQFGLAAAVLVAAVIYGFALDDPGGFVIAMGVFVALVLSALATTGSGALDRAPRYPSVADSPPVQTVTVERTQTRPSPWPLVGATAAGILAVGLAISDNLVVVGVVGLLVAAAGWLSQSWREDPSFAGPARSRISERLIEPIGFPALAVTLIAVLVIGVSRVLLAVPKEASVAVAGGVAVLVLVVFFLIAARPRVGRSALAMAAAVAVAGVVVAGGVSAASGYRTFEKHETGDPAAVNEVAQGIAYKVKSLTVTAGKPVTITFTNLDAGTYHDVAVYTTNPGGTPIWAGEPIKGVKKMSYTTVFNTPGKYSFRCDFHPAMVGTFTVVNP